jgi:hypothetical protein
MKLRLLILALASTLVLHAADPLPVFNATLTVGKEHRFILISGSKTSPFLKLGDAFEGYTLKAFDAKTSTLDLEREGKTSHVTLAADASVENGPAASTAPVHATIADAAALMNKMHLDDVLQRTVDMQRKAIGNSVSGIGKNFPNASPEDVAAFQQKVMDMVNSSLDPVKMKDDITRIYSETFSKDEVDQISAFYDTPIGQVMLAKQPEVQQKMQTAMMQTAGQIGPKIQSMARDFVLEQKAKLGGAPAPAAAPAPSPAPAPKP